MFLFLWILTIVISYFIGRKIVKIYDWQFDGEFGLALLFLIAGILPFLNIVAYIICLCVCIYEDKDYSESDIIKKIFLVKDEE